MLKYINMLKINKIIFFISVFCGILFFPFIANSSINFGTIQNQIISNHNFQNIIPISGKDIQKIQKLKSESILDLTEKIQRYKEIIKSPLRDCSNKTYYSDCFFIRTYNNGEKYYGDFKSNYRHGKGYYEFTNGTAYLGDWKYGKYNGYGTLSYSNGLSFSGKWFKGKREGRGQLKDINGTVLYNGYWKKDKKSGYFFYIDKSGKFKWRIYKNGKGLAYKDVPIEVKVLQDFLSGKLSAIAYNEIINGPKLFDYSNHCDFNTIKGISKKYLNPIVIHQINGRSLRRFVVINPQNSKEIIQKAYINSRTFPFNFKYKIQRNSNKKLFFDIQDKILNENSNFNGVLWGHNTTIKNIEHLNYEETFASILIKTRADDEEVYLSNLKRYFGQPIGKIISYWSEKRIAYEFNRILLSGVQKYRNGDSRQSSYTTSSKIYYCPTDKVNILLEEYRKNLIPKLKSANQLRYASLKKQDEMDKKQRLEEEQKRKKRLAERKKKEKERERKTTQRGGWKCIPYGFSTEGNTKYCLASCSKPGVRVSRYGLWKTINKFQECGLAMGYLPSGSVSGIGTWEGPRWR